MRFDCHRLLSLTLLLVSLPCILRADEPQDTSDRAERFAEVGPAARFQQILGLIDKSNARKLIGSDRWDEVVELHRRNVLKAESHPAFARAVNTMIEDGGISHFGYCTDRDYILTSKLSDSP